MATKIDAVWDRDKEISMLRKALHNADKELQELRNKHKEEGKEKGFVKVPIGEVLKVTLEIPANAEPGKHVGKIVAIEETANEKSFKELYKQEHAERRTMWHSVMDLSKERDILKDKWHISNSEVISCKSKIEFLKDILKSSLALNVVLGIATVVFAYFTNI